MTTKNIIGLFVMILGILLSAFFSSSETAITSVNKFKLRQLEEKNVKNASLLRKLVDDSQNTITTILVGNNIVNIVTTTIAALFFTDIFGAAGAFISTVVVTITVLIFGEVTPKLAAQINSEKIALRFSKAIYCFYNFKAYGIFIGIIYKISYKKNYLMGLIILIRLQKKI